MAKYLTACAAVGAVALAASAIGLAQTGDGSSAGGDAADANAMMSNMMIPGFDSEAGLRASQTTRDPAKRVEILARPGTTRLQALAGGHLAEAALYVVRMPPGFGRIPDGAEAPSWPASNLIGDVSDQAPDVLVGTALWLDGCSIQMPPDQAGFTDPNRARLSFQDGLWTLEVHGSGDSDDHTISYTFDRRTVKAERISLFQADYNARWSISEEPDVYPRQCHSVGRRQFGSRAELAARASR